MSPALFRLPPSEPVTRIDRQIADREIHFTQIKVSPITWFSGRRSHTPTSDRFQSAATFETFDENPFIKMVKAMNPGMAVIENVVLKHYDDYYYYSKHNEKRLPVLRVKIHTQPQT